MKKNYFISNFAALLEGSEFSASQIEVKLGWTRNSISNTKKGFEVSFDKLIDISNFFDISIDKLLKEDLSLEKGNVAEESRLPYSNTLTQRVALLEQRMAVLEQRIDSL